jgi:polar amino acid transport system substrate-binding protein
MFEQVFAIVRFIQRLLKITKPFIISALIPAISWCSPLPLVIGMSLDHPPFEAKSPTGEPSGISVDLAESLARFLQRPLQIQDLPFETLIPALTARTIDCILSSMTATSERRRQIAFSIPYLRTGLALLISKRSKVKNVATLDGHGRTVCVKQGTTGQLWAQEHLSKTRIVSFSSEQECIAEVAQGKADAFIYDQLSIYYAHQQHPQTTRADLSPFQIEAWAIGVHPHDADLLAAINSFLEEFKSGGGFERLREKYLREPSQAFEKAGIEFVF